MHLKKLVAAVAALVASSALLAAPVTYTLDPNHTEVIVTWSHFGLSTPSANFGGIEGTLVYDEAAPEGASVKVTIPISGMDGHVEDFNTHLRSKDFFEADKFGKATFVSTKVEKAGAGKLRVMGDLTVKDQTRPVVLDVTINNIGPHPMSKMQAAGFSATGSLKRSDFGVGAYAPNVSDDVKLVITTEALESKAMAARKAKQQAEAAKKKKA